jgi:TolB-like protein
MGDQHVKNIARPVRVFALRPEAVAELPPASVLVGASRRRTSAIIASVSAVAVALVIGVITWWSQSDMSPASTLVRHGTGTESLASPAALKPLAPPRLSIVVLPFANLTNNPEQQYFADGITDDLTTDLSRISDIFVIARNTAFTYKDKSVDVTRIGRDLGVRYALEGSIRRSGEMVRVNAQLVDAQTGAHLWAERFDRDLGNFFDLQNEITGRIARALQSQLVIAEARRPVDRPDAQDYILRGRATLTKPISRENYIEAETAFEHALALEPAATEAQIGLARVLVSRALDQMSNSADADIKRAEDLIAPVLRTAPSNPWPHYVKAQTLRARFRYEEAILEYEMVIALDRNFADAYAFLAWCKLVTGFLDEVVSLEERAMRLCPRDPIIASWYYDLGVLHLLQSRTGEAIAWFEKARITDPGRLCAQMAGSCLWSCRQYRTSLRGARRSSEDKQCEFEHSVAQFCAKSTVAARAEDSAAG